MCKHLSKNRRKTPGAANNLLDALRAMCRWASGPRELLSRDPTQGVAHFQQGEGHKPWTPEQLAFADEHFAGMLRRAYVLARYTGQRISDVVRLGWTDIDDGGFSLPQKRPAFGHGARSFQSLKPKWRSGRSDRGLSYIRTTANPSLPILCGNGSKKPEKTSQLLITLFGMVCAPTPSSGYGKPVSAFHRFAMLSE